MKRLLFSDTWIDSSEDSALLPRKVESDPKGFDGVDWLVGALVIGSE